MLRRWLVTFLLTFLLILSLGNIRVGINPVSMVVGYFGYPFLYEQANLKIDGMMYFDGCVGYNRYTVTLNYLDINFYSGESIKGNVNIIGAVPYMKFFFGKDKNGGWWGFGAGVSNNYIKESVAINDNYAVLEMKGPAFPMVGALGYDMNIGKFFMDVRLSLGFSLGFIDTYIDAKTPNVKAYLEQQIEQYKLLLKTGPIINLGFYVGFNL